MIALGDVSRLVRLRTSRAGADLLLEVDRAPFVADAVQAMFGRLPQLRQGGLGHARLRSR
jgi:hypothetical protein